MGCGEAKLAEQLPQHKVHSFDLGDGGNSAITVCDIRNTPLETASVDAVVFCLSLMGTNAEDFVIEGARVLKPGGVMFIAEVRSRVEGESEEDKTEKLKGGAGPKQVKKRQRHRHGISPKLRAFVHGIQTIGGNMRVASLENRNSMFFIVELRKAGGTKRGRSRSKGKEKGARTAEGDDEGEGEGGGEARSAPAMDASGGEGGDGGGGTGAASRENTAASGEAVTKASTAATPSTSRSTSAASTGTAGKKKRRRNRGKKTDSASKGTIGAGALHAGAEEQTVTSSSSSSTGTDTVTATEQ